jgi:putative addiction module component (TIGR02574 family)
MSTRTSGKSIIETYVASPLALESSQGAVMSSMLQQFGLDALSADDRIALAEALWDSVHEALDQAPIAPEVRDELERRAALSDADPSRGIPWDVVRADARTRWGR